jgi:hypothetical protein
VTRLAPPPRPRRVRAPARGAERFGISRNALRLSARRRLVRALTVRNKVYVNEADLTELYAPKPYPPIAA